MPNFQNKYTPEQIEFAREKWNQGCTATQIAAMMKTTKNAICGLARRNNFPRHTLAKVSTPASRERSAWRAAMDRAQKPSEVVRLVTVRPEPVKYYSAAQCCWPIGEPRTPGFRYCDEATVNGTYCTAHCAQAYLRRVA